MATSVLAGALSALAFAPIHFWPVIFVSFPALILLLDRGTNFRRAFAIGWAFGFGQFLTGMYWVGHAFLAQDDAPAWGAVPAVMLLATGLAIFPGLILGAMRRWLWGATIWRAITTACAWWLAEWLRGTLFTGFPWNPVGSVWAGSDEMMQIAALIGLPGLSFITVLLACAPTSIADWHQIRWRASILPAAAAGILILQLAFGLWRLPAEVGQKKQARTESDVTIVVVQANIAQADKWLPSRRRQNLELHMKLSEAATRSLDPLETVLVIWPETAVPYLPANNPGLRRMLGTIVPKGGALVTGAPHDEGPDGFNSLFAFDGTGDVLARYDKIHLVPFGEYLPLRSVLGKLGLDRMVAGTSDFKAGDQRSAISLDGVPAFSPLICYEVIFPGAVVSDEPGGEPAKWLLNLTNDAWFGKSWGPHQHLALARFRAVEEGLPLVRSTGTGISAIVDAYGQTKASLDLGIQGTLVHQLPHPIRPPLFAHYGELPAWTLFLALLGLALRHVTGRKAQSRGELA